MCKYADEKISDVQIADYKCADFIAINKQDC